MEPSGQLHAMDALPWWKMPLVPIEYEAEWAQKPVWTFYRKQKSLDPVRIQNLHHPAHSLVIILNELHLNGGNG
jgi:hypothetical protein